MWSLKEIKVGDNVVLIDDLVSNLTFKKYIVERIYESGPKGSTNHYSYHLQDLPFAVSRNAIHLVSSCPMVKIYITDGQYETMKRYIDANKDYLKRRSINISVGFPNDVATIWIEYNFENIVDFFHLSSDIGRLLQSDDEGIKERDEQSMRSRLKGNGDVEANRRWNEHQDSYNNIDDNYDIDGIRNDDPYNPNNWQGHDD